MFDNKYPYTDYHELNLDWFMGEFKKLVAEWEETKGEWNTLHDYVQNYFENLNVQTEIDNKINAMIADGTFADIVSPFVTATLPALVAGQLPDVVAAQISAVVAAQISAVVAAQLPAVAAAAAAQEVGDWLAANIDPDTGYVIDKSLTVSDAAADAKVTGEFINVIASSINYTRLYDRINETYTLHSTYSNKYIFNTVIPANKKAIISVYLTEATASYIFLVDGDKKILYVQNFNGAAGANLVPVDYVASVNCYVGVLTTNVGYKITGTLLGYIASNDDIIVGGSVTALPGSSPSAQFGLAVPG